MTNADKPKQDYSAGLKALREHLIPGLPNTIFDSMWVIQFCYQCKNSDCMKVYPLESGVHTVEAERVQAELAGFAKGFEEPRTIECQACHFVAEYHPKDVGFDILEKLGK